MWSLLFEIGIIGLPVAVIAANAWKSRPKSPPEMAFSFKDELGSGVHPQVELVAELLKKKEGWVQDPHCDRFFEHPSGVRFYMNNGPIPVKYYIQDATGEWKASVPISETQKHYLKKLLVAVQEHIQAERDSAVTKALAKRVIAFEQGALPSVLAGPELGTGGEPERIGVDTSTTTLYNVEKRQLETYSVSPGDIITVNCGGSGGTYMDPYAGRIGVAGNHLDYEYFKGKRIVGYDHLGGGKLMLSFGDGSVEVVPESHFLKSKPAWGKLPIDVWERQASKRLDF